MTHLAIMLYDPVTNEPVKEYTRSFVPWKILKRAIRLMKKFGEGFNPETMNEEDADELAALVVDAFGGQFSVSELDDGADLGEMMTVLTAIMASAVGTPASAVGTPASAVGTGPNPIPPPRPSP